MKDFMELTIKAHELRCLTPDEVAHFTPSREANFFEAKELAQTSTYFERQNILVADDCYTNAPMSAYRKSFEKWLGLQKHDVEAVNSLYLRQKEVQMRQYELMDEIYDLENMSTAPALQIHVDKLLARKEAQYRELSHLLFNLRDAVEKVRAAKCSARKTA